jgi:hypothetical protein
MGNCCLQCGCFGTCCCCCKKCFTIEKPGTKFSEIRKTIKPFDLVLFRGGEFVSDVISTVQKMVFGNGDFTHVGVVITPEIFEFPNCEKGELYVWESTMSGKLGDGVNSTETKTGVFGVQIRKLKDVVDAYDSDPATKIAVAHLNNNPFDQLESEDGKQYEERIIPLKKKISDFHTKRFGKGYDWIMSSLASAPFGCCVCINNCWDGLMSCLKCNCASKFSSKDKYFCSELATEIYQVIGALPDDIIPNTMAPVEFLNLHNTQKSIFSKPQLIIKDKTIVTENTHLTNEEKSKI